MTNATDPAVVYLRRSRDPHHVASLADQERHGRADVAAQGWELAAVLGDAGRSASRFAKKGRPGWDELLGMIEAGQARIIVLWESNRGDRKLTEWSAFLDLCRERGVLIRIVTHERTYNVSNHRDWKTLAEDGVSSAHFSETLSADVRRGQAGAALRGEPYGPVPFGYKAVYSERTGKREGWKIDPPSDDIVRHIVIWIGAGKPVLALERDMRSRGQTSPLGLEWRQSTIRKMAANPVYAGLRKLPDGTLVEGKWPAIVTRQQWADACAALDSRRTQARPGKQKHLLSHLARCAECKSPLVVHQRHGTMYYRCKDSCFSVYYEWLDKLVTDVICERLSRPDARELFKTDDKRPAQLESEVATLIARRSGFRKKAATGAIEEDALAEIEAELNPLIAAKQADLDAAAIPAALRDIVTSGDVRAAWAGYEVQQRRSVIAAVTGIKVSRPARQWRRMVVSTDLVEFDWKPQSRRVDAYQRV